MDVSSLRPHFDSHGIRLFVGDARSLPLDEIGVVDCVIADPPYGIGAHATGHRKRPHARSLIAGDESSDMGVAIVQAAWCALKISRHAYVFGPFDLSDLPFAAGRCQLVWDKVLPTMGDLAHPYGSQHEPIQFAMRAGGQLHAKRGGLLARLRGGSVLRYQRPHASGAKHHIAEKPVPLLRALIEMSTRHGEVVLDPCTGSGSTLVAALAEGRRAIGIELEHQWADVAAERLTKMIAGSWESAWELT